MTFHSILYCSVLQSMDEDTRRELKPLKLREKAAKFAKNTVNIQMNSFKVKFLSLTFHNYTICAKFTSKDLPISYYIWVAFMFFWI